MHFTVRPVGYVRSPFVEKVDAPRQAAVSKGVDGEIEVLPEFEHALADLDGFERIWVLFWFDRAPRPAKAATKVLPPRSDRKRGVFATRSPHRPNPIGLSVVRLVRLEGRVLHVRELDMLTGTPVLDLKPYLPYADSFAESRMGWLEQADPKKAWHVSFAASADERLDWIAARLGSDLRGRIRQQLALGPEPHPYRRIKPVARDDGSVAILAVKDWRVRFRVDGRAITVEAIETGYRARDLVEGTTDAHELHRAFAARFGAPFG